MGDTVLTMVGYRGFPSSDGIVAVRDEFRFIEGRYAVGLAGGSLEGSGGPIVPASISQTGGVPESANSLLFLGILPSVNRTEVLVNGVVQPLVSLGPVGAPGEYTLYGLNMSSFAGQEVDLSFVNYADPRTGQGGALLDSLRFSTYSVPEPRVSALLGIGSLVLLGRWAVRRRRREG